VGLIDEGIDIGYKLIEENRVKLNKGLHAVTKNFRFSINIRGSNDTIENLIKVYLLFEDYISNTYLVFYGFMLSNKFVT
jgi:hypothetical protein